MLVGVGFIVILSIATRFVTFPAIAHPFHPLENLLLTCLIEIL